jgi:hypothetical protein
MTMSIIMKLALAAALAAALASSALAIAGKLRAPDDAITMAQYCMPHEDDNVIAQRVYCRDAG